MYTHPEIHSELARQRQADGNREYRHRARQTQATTLDGLGQLVQAARAGDQDAWELLVRRFTPTLRRVVRGYRLSETDIDDVVQTTWTAAFTHIGSVRVPDAFAGWLMVTARRASLRAIERGRREVVVDDEHLPEDVTHQTPESTVLKAEQRKALNAALNRLSERQGKVVRTLFRNSGASYADLADTLGIPVGSIGPTRERALARLREDDQLIAGI
jgi:RNA polymerase sigma factor (sigma-70 family)